MQYALQVLWFTSLVSKAGNLPGIEAALKKAGAKAVRIVEMGQGQKQSRMVAWSFHDHDQRQAWNARRKSEA
ncbi:Ribosomal RNA large subunit methyltransferase F [compost metagenome]